MLKCILVDTAISTITLKKYYYKLEIPIRSFKLPFKKIKKICVKCKKEFLAVPNQTACGHWKQENTCSWKQAQEKQKARKGRFSEFERTALGSGFF